MSESPETTPLSAAIHAAAVKACEEHYETEHVAMTIPCNAAIREAEWWAAALDAARATVPAGPECAHEWEPMTGVACFRCEAVQYVRAARPVPAAEPPDEAGDGPNGAESWPAWTRTAPSTGDDRLRALERVADEARQLDGCSEDPTCPLDHEFQLRQALKALAVLSTGAPDTEEPA